MKITVRRAVHADFNCIYLLFEQLWPDKELDKDELMRVFNRGIESDADEFFCAEVDGNIIGFCAYAVMNNFWQAGYISYIYAMVIDENYRGKGIGTKLINEAINKSRAQGFKRIELDSGFPREKAHNFYEKLGFEKRAYLFSMKL